MIEVQSGLMLMHLFESTSIKGRFVLYGTLAAIALLTFSDAFLNAIFFTFGIAYFAGLAAWYLLIYLPLIDWPLLAWRRTRSRQKAFLWLFLALLVPIVLPVAVAIHTQLVAGTTIQAMQLENKSPSTSPFKPTSILIVDNSNESYPRCGELCIALVWSGAVERITTARVFPEDGGVKNAVEYHVDHDLGCSGKRTEDHRGNKCVVGRKVENPVFDAVITTRQFYDPNLQIYGSSANLSFEQQVRLYDCRRKCTLIAAQASATGHRLGFPLGITFKLDQNNLVQPITRRFELGNPLDVLHRAFLLDLRPSS